MRRIKRYIMWGVLICLLMGCGSNLPSNIEFGNLEWNEVVTDAFPSIAYSKMEIPAYSGYPYVEINGNKPFFSDADKLRSDVFEEYSELDALGRCQVAYASVCKELMPTEPRGEIGSVKPSGWHTVKYNELIDGNYLYNRCHLIGYQLAGENANEKNLITGTRYLNVIGMLPFENDVRDYIDRNEENHVLYRVTPMFTGDNLVADGVLMEAFSLEDNGKGLSFCVFCYNIQPGIRIDYATGDSWEDPSVTSRIDNSDPFYAPEQTESSTKKKDYVLNTSSMKIHMPDCKYVEDIKSSNKTETTDTLENLLSEGYVKCKACFGN